MLLIVKDKLSSSLSSSSGLRTYLLSCLLLPVWLLLSSVTSLVFRPDEELRELESLSLTIKSMFCERENVPVLNSCIRFGGGKVYLRSPVHSTFRAFSSEAFVSERSALEHRGTLNVFLVMNKSTTGLPHLLNSHQQAGVSRVHSWPSLPLDRASALRFSIPKGTLDRLSLHPFGN